MNVGDFMLQKGFRHVKILSLDEDGIKFEDINGNTSAHQDVDKADLEHLQVSRLSHLHDMRTGIENQLGFLNEMISFLEPRTDNKVSVED